MKKTRRRSHRRTVMHRALSGSQKLYWNRQADALLAHAGSIFEQSANFDSAVRDSIAEGLAYIVNAAFDCRANAMPFADMDSWLAFIDQSTAQWFRTRGFVEWFCGGAASLFRTTPPRFLAQPVDASLATVLGKAHRLRARTQKRRNRRATAQKSANTKKANRA